MLRERTGSRRFEEIQGEDEGYEIDEDEDFVGGFVPQDNKQPQPAQRGSWFGWGSSTATSSRNDGYEHLKNQ